jgi:hypothetical protein
MSRFFRPVALALSFLCLLASSAKAAPTRATAADLQARIARLRQLKSSIGRDLRRARIKAGISRFNLLARDLNARIAWNYRDACNLVIRRLERMAASGTAWKHTVQLGNGATTTVISERRDRPRVAIFATAGNPIQHGHLLTPLRAIGLGHADAAVFRIQGPSKSKPDLAGSEDMRRQLAQKAIQPFPVFGLYQDRKTSSLRGEHDLANFLGLPDQPRLDVKFIAGADEYNSYGTPEKPNCLGHLSRQLPVARAGGHALSGLMSLRTLRMKPSQFTPARVPPGFEKIHTEPLRGLRYGLDSFTSASAVRLALDPRLARRRDSRLKNKPGRRWHRLLVPAQVLEQILDTRGDNPYISAGL